MHDQRNVQIGKLVRLSDSGMELASPAEDIRGRQVVDAEGEEIGEVDGLMIDEAQKRVRFIRVASGGILGFGGTKFLIPVDAVKRVTEEVVHVDRPREEVAGAPRYDPDVVEPDYYERVYGYYGTPPFWAVGYTYPPYPVYV